jgi:diguanylate cyclase (GGDEF)-like protein/PAS domain S-box-containing protein
MKISFNRFLPGIQLAGIFFGTALLMAGYEFLKEMFLGGELTRWQSHAMTVVVTASIAVIASFFMRRWVLKVDESLRVAATVFEAQEGMLVTDHKGTIIRVNRTFTSITGYSAKEVVGRNPNMLSSGRHDEGFYRLMWDSLKSTGSWEGEVWNRRKSGEIYPEYLAITTVKDQGDVITNYVATFTDISVTKAAVDEVKHLAFYDSLTGLPNRRLLMDRLSQAFASSARSKTGGALLFIDLDNFKNLNDTLGHDKGDMLLQQVARRLESCVREGDTVARLGGDEFVVMLEDLNEDPLDAAAQTETVGEKILDKLNAPYQLASNEHHSTPSIGAVIFNNHDQSREELLKQADIAMYQAKKAGRNTLRFFDSKMQDSINARATLERELRAALEGRQFHLHYQIQVGSSHEPLGAEALIRWMHPERGLVPPLQFIPLAEETGLILPIGLWVLHTACAQLNIWRNDPLTSHLVLAVNVSARQFRQADFVMQVQTAVQRHGIDATRLKLELTESLLLESIEDTILTMNALKTIGVRLSLDDFGTGYSSLQYLKRLPLDQLKIDQSFVRDIVTDSSDRAIVRTIIAMASSLNMSVIAEGVETEEQRRLLFSKGCRHYQGYLFGKPDAIDLLET